MDALFEGVSDVHRAIIVIFDYFIASDLNFRLDKLVSFDFLRSIDLELIFIAIEDIDDLVSLFYSLEGFKLCEGSNLFHGAVI